MAAALKINTASAMYIDWLMRAIHDWLALADTCLFVHHYIKRSQNKRM